MSSPRNRRAAAGCAALVGAVLALSPLATGAAGRTVSFRAADGRTVAALMLEADERPAPAVILVPMLGQSRDSWEGVAQRLAEANIHALALDLPGQALPEDPRALAGWSAEVGAAAGYLFSRGDVRAGAIGVAGASLGANLAAVAAAGDSRIRSLALISPSLDYRGVRIEAPMRQYGDRPALLLASARDPYAARTVRELAKATAGLREVRWSETQAHGTVLLARDPDLVRALVEWFQRTLG